MNDEFEFERTVAKHISSVGPSPPSDGFHDELISRARRSRQRPEWLALIQEVPMRSDSKITVGSPTVRVAAILAAAVLLTVSLVAAGLAGRQLLAADGPIIVDQSGDGAYRTITDALADSEDGDVILVRPGTYIEAVVIDKDITLTGDGPVDEIVISAPADEPVLSPEISTVPDQRYAMLFADSQAVLSDLTLRGEGSTLIVVGGAPVLSGLVFDRVNEQGREVDDQRAAVLFIDDSAGTLRGSTFIESDDVQIRGSAPLIEDNTLSGGSSIWGGMENETIIRGNRIDGSMGASIFLQEQTEALIEGNTINDPLEEGGIWVKGGPPTGVTILSVENDPEPTIRGNTITVSGDVPGIHLTPRVGGRVTDNTIDAASTGIFVDMGSTTVISGNTICAGMTAIEVEEPNKVDIGDNELCEDATAE